MNNTQKVCMHFLNFIELAGGIGIPADELSEKLVVKLGLASYDIWTGYDNKDSNLSTNFERTLEGAELIGDIKSKHYRAIKRYAITASGITKLIKLKCGALDDDLVRLNKRLLGLEIPEEKKEWQTEEALNGRR